MVSKTVLRFAMLPPLQPLLLLLTPRPTSRLDLRTSDGRIASSTGAGKAAQLPGGWQLYEQFLVMRALGFMLWSWLEQPLPPWVQLTNEGTEPLKTVGKAATKVHAPGDQGVMLTACRDKLAAVAGAGKPPLAILPVMQDENS